MSPSDPSRIALFHQLHDSLARYQILLSTYKHKAPRPPPSTVDFDLSDIIGDAASNANHDSVKQANVAIETLAKDINVEEISLTQRHRDLEHESKQVNEGNVFGITRTRRCV